MPKAMVSIAVTQISPGTIGHGVRLIEDHVPRSGYPARGAVFGCAAPTSAEVRTPLQFLRVTAPKPLAHRNSNAGNPHPNAPAK